MKKNLLSILGVATLIFASAIIPNEAIGQTAHPDYQDGKLFFKLKDNVVLTKHLSIEKGIENNKSTMPFLNQIIKNHADVKITKPFPKAIESKDLMLTYKMEFSDYTNVNEIINELESTGKIDYVEKIPIDKLCYTPNDPLYGVGSNSWGLTKIQAEQAWNVGTGSSSVVVAVTDNAIEIAHADLTNVIWTNTAEIPNNNLDDDNNGYVDDVNGFDVGDTDGDVSPLNSSWDHGTHVSGTVGCETDNNTGLASIGFGISIMPVKVTTDQASSSSVTNGYDGIYYAALNNADVINCSWGGYGYIQTYQNLVSWAYGQGSIIVAAAGNDNKNMDSPGNAHYPSNYNDVICVASSSSSDAKSGFSNYGSAVDVTAPGSNIGSTVPFGNYAFMSGTSMASPLVAGLLGLMKSLNPSVPNSTLINCLTTTCDNINAQNPSYIGDLGSGRINAFQAMNCMSTTLNNPPNAEFTANFTTINVGGTVNFTDLSTFAPTSWSWSFSPATVTYTGATNSSSQNPQVVFNNAGSYTVTLTASNANGSDIEQKTAYIQVNATTGCDTLTNTLPGDTIYTYSLPSGYLGGQNNYNITRWAEYYSNYAPNTHIQGGMFYFTRGKIGNNPNSSVKVVLWNANGPGGAPGTVMASQIVPLQTIVNNANPAPPATGFIPTQVFFDNPVAISGNFYLGVEVTNAPGDSIATAYTQTLNQYTTRPNTAWLEYNGTWSDVPGLFGGTQLTMWNFVYATTLPVTANATPTNSTVCEGDIVNFSSSGSTGASNYDWFFNGAGTSTSTQPNPSVTYTTTGSYYQYLLAYNSCGFYNIDTAIVTIDPSPSLTITTTNDTICSGSSTTVTASGTSTSYLWNPGGSTNASINVSPTTTTTYTVTGTLGSCSENASQTIYVENAPVAAATFSPSTNICPNQSVTFDGTSSVDAGTYNWTFSAGSPSVGSATGPFATLSFGSSGTHPYTLVVSNSCGTNTFNGTVLIDVCTGVEDLAVNQSLNASYNNSGEYVNLTLNDFDFGKYNLTILNTVGQVVVDKTINVNADYVSDQVSLASMAKGVYYINIFSNETRYTAKIVKF